MSHFIIVLAISAFACATFIDLPLGEQTEQHRRWGNFFLSFGLLCLALYLGIKIF